MKNVTKNIIALCTGILLVAGLELVLALAGVPSLSDKDLFAGFDGSLPTFIEKPGDSDARILNPAKSNYFNPQQFTSPKPGSTFRIVYFGGSTTYGRPYIARTAFPRWVGDILGLGGGPVRYENLNLGGISYASHRVLRLAREMTAYQPDLFVIYSGHNEFLEAVTFEKLREEPSWARGARQILHRSRIYSVVSGLVSQNRQNGKDKEDGGVDAILEEIGGYDLYHRDDNFRSEVIQRYRESLDELCRLAAREKIPVVLCTLPSNLVSISPFKSEHRPGLDKENTAVWEDLFNRAEKAYSEEHYSQALELADRASTIDDKYAYLHYLRGHILLKLGRNKEARQALVRAKEEDIVPLRALEVFNKTVRELAIKYSLPLADVAEVFSSETPSGIPGPELFTDHVHPTIKGQQLVAWTILESLAGRGILPQDPLKDAASRASALSYLKEQHDLVPARYRAMGYWGVGRVYHWAHKIPEAWNALLISWQTVRDIAEIPYLLGDIELARGNTESAVTLFKEADRIGGEEIRVAYGMASAAMRMGDPGEALKVLRGMPESVKNSPRYIGLTGEALVRSGKLSDGIVQLERSVRLAPSARQFLYSLALAYLRSGDEARARETYERYADLIGGNRQSFENFTKSAAGSRPKD